MVEPQARITRPAVSLVIPEGVDALFRVQFADRVTPALCHQRGKGRTALRLDQGILVPRARRVDVDLIWRNVVVAGEHHGQILLDQGSGMALEAREPVELVVEFRSRLRIAVRQVDAGDDDTAYRGLDVAGLVIGRLSRQ